MTVTNVFIRHCLLSLLRLPPLSLTADPFFSYCYPLDILPLPKFSYSCTLYLLPFSPGSLTSFAWTSYCCHLPLQMLPLSLLPLPIVSPTTAPCLCYHFPCLASGLKCTNLCWSTFISFIVVINLYFNSKKFNLSQLGCNINSKSVQ